jgi:hypothetical protein
MCQIPISGLGICLFCHFKGKKKDEKCFYKPTGDILKGLPQYFVTTVKISSILHLISFGIKKTYTLQFGC